jgi:hypothetical protein
MVRCCRASAGSISGKALAAWVLLRMVPAMWHASLLWVLQLLLQLLRLCVFLLCNLTCSLPEYTVCGTCHADGVGSACAPAQSWSRHDLADRCRFLQGRCT